MLNKFFNFSEFQLIHLEKFYHLHIDAQLNLTAIKGREEFYYKHILDSVYFLRFLDIDFETAIDLGSGGGFPGVILAIYFPDKKFYLVESISKKCAFLQEAIFILGLQNVCVINERCETIKNLKVDLIFSRGVGKVKDILQWTKNVSHETTGYVLYKGEQLDAEVKDAYSVLKKRGMEANHVRVEEPIKRSYLYINSSYFWRVRPKA
mgnify:CR=1 FL=1